MTSVEHTTIRRQVSDLLAAHTAAEAAHTETVLLVDKMKIAAEATQEAHEIIQTVAVGVQLEAHQRISGVVSRCLATVFEEPYVFQLKWDRARGRTEVRMVFMRDGMEVDPMDAAGGGVVDVAAFALRLACLMLHRPSVRRTVVLDEPFKFVSADRRGCVRRMLEDLSEELDVQFIMVTHIEELKCGQIVEVS